MSDRIGSEEAEKLLTPLNALPIIELGYREIMRFRDSLQLAAMPPLRRTSALLQSAAEQYHDIALRMAAHDPDPLGFVSSHSIRLTSRDGTTQLSPDAMTNAIIDSLGSNLMLEGFRNGWFLPDGTLALPRLPSAADADVQACRPALLLALSWQSWQNIEERSRYLGGILEWASPDRRARYKVTDSQKLAYYEPDKASLGLDVLEAVAQDRLSDRMLMWRLQRGLNGDLDPQKVDAISKPVIHALDSVISASNESHATDMLSTLLAFDITTDNSLYNGLSLVDWLRGYSALQSYARDAYPLFAVSRSPNEMVEELSRRGAASLLGLVSASELADVLGRAGMKRASAEAFIRAASFKRTSRDLFDAPLIATGDDSLTVFCPAILPASLTRVVLSVISSAGAVLEKKGSAFEEEFRRFLLDAGYDVRTLRFRRSGEEYEYDALMRWAGYIFLFECKNRALPDAEPIASFNFRRDLFKDVDQVKRLARALSAHRDALNEVFEADTEGESIVPCLVHSMPFSVPGGLNGVFVVDASALQRFFSKRDLSFTAFRHELGKPAMARELPIMPQWAGNAPTVQEFLRHLVEPIQLRVGIQRMKIEERGFWLSDSTLAASIAVSRELETLESSTQALGVSSEEVRGWVSALDDAPSPDVTRLNTGK